MFVKNELVPFVNDIRKHVIGYDNLWDDLVHRNFNESYPKDNVMQVDNTVVIELALAGFNKDEIEIERDGTSLEVRGSKKLNEEKEDVTYVRRGIAYRAFTKRYTVGAEYKDVKAEFNNGILTISLEREPEKETKQLVEIK